MLRPSGPAAMRDLSCGHMTSCGVNKMTSFAQRRGLVRQEVVPEKTRGHKVA